MPDDINARETGMLDVGVAIRYDHARGVFEVYLPVDENTANVIEVRPASNDRWSDVEQVLSSIVTGALVVPSERRLT